ncbi:MAG: type IIL restriction-modification enzyme MmeI, partial [Akkermansiaceae bacterium]
MVGFGAHAEQTKKIYDYDNAPDNPIIIEASNISPFLIQGGDVTLANRSRPICDVPEIQFGSMPNDGGRFLFTQSEKAEFLEASPESLKLGWWLVGLM